METVTISKKEYETLQRDARMLAALQAGGVDNWYWYGETLEAFWAEEEENEQ
jgi:hypothetical protein